MLALLPYTGPWWYSRQATQFLLRHSLQVAWRDIKWTYTATAHLPADFFREPLAKIERTIAPELVNPATSSRLGLCA